MEDYKSRKSLSDRARKTTKRVWGELAMVWRLSSADGIHDVRLERKHAISNHETKKVCHTCSTAEWEGEGGEREECCPYRRMTVG